MMVTLFRIAWLLSVIVLAFGPILSTTPLLGFTGGIVKLLIAAMAGPLFAVHILLLLGYGGLTSMGILSFNQVRVPALISTMACASLLLPPLLSLLFCSPEFHVEDVPSQSLSFLMSKKKGFSLPKWITPSECPPLTDYRNVTTTFRHRIPSPIGPASREDSFLNSQTRQLWDSMFSNETRTRLQTLYFPPPLVFTAKKTGVLIMVHGGGWWTGEADMTPFHCHVMHAHAVGWGAATLEYRLGRDGWSGEDQVKDVKDAVKHIVKHHKQDVDPSRVILVGSSAGAHLALLSAYQLNNENTNNSKPMIAGVVALSPSTSIEIGLSDFAITRWRGAWDESMATKRLCEGVADCHQKLSPIEHVSKNSPKTILVHSGSDEYYTPQHSRALHQALIKMGIPHVFMEPPMMPHLFDNVESLAATQLFRHSMKCLMQSLPSDNEW